MRGNDERHVHDAAATTSHMQKRRQPGEQTQQTNEKNGIEMRVLRATAEQGTRATRASRNTANATQNTDASQRRRVEGPNAKATSTQGKAPAAARERDKARHGTDGEEEWDSADEALSSDAARAREAAGQHADAPHRPDPNKPASADEPDVISQKLLDTAPERKESTQDASKHIQTASSPVATVLAGARGQKRVANYDEIGHRTGDRERKGRCT